MKKYFHLAFVLILLNSCSNDGNSGNNGNSGILVKEINSKTVNYDGTESTLNTKYFYIGNKISSISYGYSLAPLITVEKYFYTNDLITATTHGDGYNAIYSESHYQYDSDSRMIQETTVSNNNTNHDLKIYTYNPDNTVIRESYHGTTVNPAELYETVKIHFDSNNRFIKLETFDGSNWSLKNEITYSNYNSPFKNIVGYDKLYLLTDAKFGFWIYKNYTNTSTYQYSHNAANYPTRRIEKYKSLNGGTFWTTTNDYTYY